MPRKNFFSCLQITYAVGHWGSPRWNKATPILQKDAAMSAVDAENLADDVASDIHVGNASHAYEFRPLSEEEKQDFLSLADRNARRSFAEQADRATNSIEGKVEEDGGSAGRELLLLPPAEQTLVPLVESSCCGMTVQSLDDPTHQVTPSRPRQDRSAVSQVLFPLLISVTVFFLVLNFYPLLQSWLPISINQTDGLQSSISNPLPVLTAIPASSPEVAKPPAPDARVQSEIVVAPANQETANKESTEQTPPQVSTTVKPTAQTMRGQAKKKRGHQQRVAQLTEPSWLTGPSWSRNADSFIKFLFFGRVN
jgi:hypothetical protein